MHFASGCRVGHEPLVDRGGTCCGAESSSISEETGTTFAGSSSSFSVWLVKARSSCFAAAIDEEMAVSVARLHKLANGEERTYLRNALDDHLPKTWMRQRSTPACARWQAPEALAEWPVCLGAPLSQWVSSPSCFAISVNVHAQPCLVGFCPCEVGNNHWL